MKYFGLASVLAMLGLALLSLAYMFRYEPFPSSSGNPMALLFVWDRWEARACVTGAETNHRLLCTVDELDRFTKEAR